MSEHPTGASTSEYVDPLEQLRSADPRPLHQQWRDRFTRRFRSFGSQTGIGVVVLSAVVLIGFLWNATRSGQTQVEQSLPFAGAAARQPEPAGPVAVPESTTPLTVVVHVAGGVVDPGLVRGMVGWRVADAIDAASGPVRGADLDRVNLAATLRDGERIYIPLIGEDAPPALTGTSVDDADAAGPINLNGADAGALEELPGIGPATAATIVEHRDEHGPFGSVDALIAVRGIGAAKLDAIRDHVIVG